MILFFLVLIGLLPLRTHAIGVEDIGEGDTGIATMWEIIKSYLPDVDTSTDWNPDAGSPKVGAISWISERVIDAIFMMIGSAAVIIILYAAVRLVTSAGNDETVRKAWKEIILYAALGLIFAVLGQAIIDFVIQIVKEAAMS